MNDNARLLYEDLKAGRLDHFNMSFEIDEDCGAPSCIAGHCAYRAGLKIKGDGGLSDEYSQIAADYLGLSFKVTQDLCYPWSRGNPKSPWFGIAEDPWNATQQQAAEAMKRACELSEAK